MALSFGVTVLPDPPASRLVELMKLGEDNGFEIGWTCTTRTSWQDSFPALTLAIQGTSRMKFGHLVTNPARVTRPSSQACTRRCTTSPTAAW